MTLSLGDYGLLVSIVALPLGVVGLYLRSIRADYHKFQAAINDRLADQRTQLLTQDERLRDVEQHKVSHKDWVRVVVSQTKRQDETNALVRELTGKLDGTIGVAASINRLAKVIEEQRGAH